MTIYTIATQNTQKDKDLTLEFVEVTVASGEVDAAGEKQHLKKITIYAPEPGDMPNTGEIQGVNAHLFATAEDFKWLLTQVPAKLWVEIQTHAAPGKNGPVHFFDFGLLNPPPI